jgi:hypothetical protein
VPARRHFFVVVDVLEADALRTIGERGVFRAHHHMWWAAPLAMGGGYEDWWPERVMPNFAIR